MQLLLAGRPSMATVGSSDPQDRETLAMRRMNFEKWWDKFKPTGTPANPCGPSMGDAPRGFETFGADLETVRKANEANPDTVWTLVDDGTRWGSIIPGMHWVNRMGYFITEVAAPVDHPGVKV